MAADTLSKSQLSLSRLDKLARSLHVSVNMKLSSIAASCWSGNSQYGKETNFRYTKFVRLHKV